MPDLRDFLREPERLRFFDSFPERGERERERDLTRESLQDSFPDRGERERERDLTRVSCLDLSWVPLSPDARPEPGLSGGGGGGAASIWSRD